jgi:hypothetical protein
MNISNSITFEDKSSSVIPRTPFALSFEDKSSPDNPRTPTQLVPRFSGVLTNSTATPLYGCSICKYKCHKPANLKLHFQTQKHLRVLRESSLSNEPLVFSCESCKFSTIKRADYNRHITTQKHKNAQPPHHQPNMQPQSTFCEVKTPHVVSSGIPQSPDIESKIETLSSAVLEIVKQNTEFQRIILETQQQTQKQCAELLESCKSAICAPTTIIHNTNTTTNNHFNLQFFLNVTCKDAINISDFISGLDIRPEHIERFGKIGFVDGITRILMDGLNSLEKHKRPIHCTDLKRDTMYIRESDQWQKDVENARLSQAIESVEQYNCRAFCKEIPPPSMKEETELIRYMTILREVNGGSSREKNRAKIVKNISKACFLDRSMDT